MTFVAGLSYNGACRILRQLWSATMYRYPQNDSADLDPLLFRDPPAAFRGAPLWSWNCALDRDRLLRQIEVLRAMGLGGFHIHVRTGLATPYLGAEFMDHVRACVERAAALGMRAWLYDEDRWPSGAAGGLVTQDARFRARYLLWTCTPYGVGAYQPAFDSLSQTGRAENGRLLWRYEVVLRDGVLAEYRRLAEDEPVATGGRVWYAYLETALPSPWFNNQTYVDTLNVAAVRRFIEVTHERYAATVGDHFGSTIPAIFTDEPQFSRKQSFAAPEDITDLTLPWTDDLPVTYRATYGVAIEETLPELFWELPGGRASPARYRYHDHVAERFAGAFADTIGAWCDSRGLLLTGHMMEEPTLLAQTTSLGEAMRSYRGFSLPGIDMLCDWREYSTAKQAQSAARQYDRVGVMSELYGVTNWDFSFAGHKGQGDWQAALGVTLRVHHLSWVSMAGEARRDYPASISYQSPWWREYRLVEDHFARLNTALTRGRSLVRVAVVHPIESYWLCYGPRAQTQIDRDERERAFADLIHWLLFGLIDFDFLCESLLPELCEARDAPCLAVGAMRYDTVIVPSMRTIRATTLDRLERFHAAGGTLIFAGDIPDLVDAQPSERARVLAAQARRVAFGRGPILAALASCREIAATLADGRPADSLLHQIRQDGVRRFVFCCNTDRERGRDQVMLTLRGEWTPTLLDTLSGETVPLPAQYDGETTRIEWDFPAHGSLLVQLAPGRAEHVVAPRNMRWQTLWMPVDPAPVTLAEPNVLLLDLAEYRLDDEPWQPVEEILRLDNALRRRLGWPLRMEAQAQPWVAPPTMPTHTLSMRFHIQVDHPVAAPLLALDNAAATRITLNGAVVPSAIAGWWVDEDIQTVALPPLGTGTHTLVLTLPYSPLSSPEWCYLLGDFGVALAGRHARIIAPVRSLAFGDWTRQGLPFYAGNVTYHLTFDGSDAELAFHAPRFAAPLLTVDCDGKRAGAIAFAPYQLALGRVAPGLHTLDITAYGSRVNAFGCVHNASREIGWYGPNAWRSDGDDWAYEYQLRPAGILTAPHMLRASDA